MRKVLLILCLTGLTYAVNAQGVRFGLTATPTFNFVNSNDNFIENNGLKIGLDYGLLVDYRIDNNERYAFSTGLIHSLSGFGLTKSDTLFPAFMGDYKFRVQYLQIPLTIRLRTNEIGYMTYYGQFGVEPGFKVAARYDYEPSAAAVGATAIDNAKSSDIVILNMPLTIGIGFEYNLSGNTNLLAGLFYRNGFTDLFQKSFNNNDKVQLRTIGLRLGVIF